MTSVEAKKKRKTNKTKTEKQIQKTKQQQAMKAQIQTAEIDYEMDRPCRKNSTKEVTLGLFFFVLYVKGLLLKKPNQTFQINKNL